MSNETCLLKSIIRRRVELIGHTLRHEGLRKLVMVGTIEGKGYKGRPRLKYIKQIMVDVNCETYEEMKRIAHDLSLIHI